MHLCLKVVVVVVVSWCFEPSQSQRITSGLNTNFTLSAGYSFHKSSYHKSCFFLAYLYSVDTQHGNPHQAGWPISFCGPTQQPVLATANTIKTRERFWKNAGEWTGKVEISKEEIHGSKYVYWPTPGFKGRTFKLYVLIRWDFNFCVRSFLLQSTCHVRTISSVCANNNITRYSGDRLK